MKTQLSRASFTPSKRYSSVYQQQGRALTDADWNELSEIVKERLNEALQDVIGSGTPQNRGIVEITNNGIKLKWGYVYVDGIVAQIRPASPNYLNNPTLTELYKNQADFPSPPDLPNSYQLYLDVWERTVLSLEDEQLRDPGLHGADTCTRTQTMAQIKWALVNTDPENPEHNPPKGTALLTLELRSETTDPDPCDPCADEVQLQDKVGNYLFRVEVHEVEYDAQGNLNKVTLKWSSENGAEQYEINNQPPGFSAKNWVYDFFHDKTQQFASEKHLGFHFAPGWSPARSQLSDGYLNTVPNGYSLVRRWDGYCVLELNNLVWKLVLGSDRGVALSAITSNTAPGHVVEGSIVVINLDTITLSIDLSKDKKLLAGDFWYVPVREAVHKMGDTLLNQVEPHGITHHYMLLANVEDDIITLPNDSGCNRYTFPPLTNLNASRFCQVAGVYYKDAGNQKMLLQMGQELSSDTLAKGLQVVLNQEISSKTVNDASVFVSAEIPFRLSQFQPNINRDATIGYQPLILLAMVDTNPQGNIVWVPRSDTLSFLQYLLSQGLGHTPKFEEEFQAIDYKEPLSNWGLNSENFVIQTSNKAGVIENSYDFSGSPTIAIHRYRTEPNVMYLGMSVANADGSSPPKDVGLVFNFENISNYWFFFCRHYWQQIGYSDAISRVEFAVAKVVEGKISVVEGQQWVGEHTPVEISLDIKRRSERLLFGGQIRFQSGSIVNVESFEIAHAPLTFTTGSHVGLLTRATGSAQFRRLQMVYPEKVVTLVPVGFPPRILTRLVLKRNLIRLANTKTVHKSSYQSSSEADFETWFWLVPPPVSYSYSYCSGYTGIGSEHITR